MMESLDMRKDRKKGYTLCPKCRGYVILGQCMNCDYKFGDKPTEKEWLKIISP